MAAIDDAADDLAPRLARALHRTHRCAVRVSDVEHDHVAAEGTHVAAYVREERVAIGDGIVRSPYATIVEGHSVVGGNADLLGITCSLDGMKPEDPAN